MFRCFGSFLVKGARTSRVAQRALVALAAAEGGVGGYRGYQSYEAWQAGDDWAAAGYAGEATLRMIGVSPKLIQGLKLRSAAEVASRGGARIRQGIAGLRDADNFVPGRWESGATGDGSIETG